MTDKRLLAIRPAEVSENVWEEFQALRQAKKAPFTHLALKGIIRESAKAKLTLEAGMTLCIERGWQGLNAEWVTGPPEKEGKKGSGLPDYTTQRRTQAEQMPSAVIALMGGMGRSMMTTRFLKKENDHGLSDARRA